jgi:hypothetical protein
VFYINILIGIVIKGKRHLTFCMTSKRTSRSAPNKKAKRKEKYEEEGEKAAGREIYM